MFKFHKMDGAGNDFVLLDNRQHTLPPLSSETIAQMCHRRIGIGADGLMTLEPAPDSTYDFQMKYYNADGGSAAMCGNGGRCIALLAYILQEEPNHRDLRFLADDGEHTARILLWQPEDKMGLVSLGMRDVERNAVSRKLDGWFLNTGVPHFVQRVEDLQHFDVVTHGREIRNRLDLFPEGTNVDFVEDAPDGSLSIRTYERGVEDETWACGTGVVAAAIVTGNRRITARGGNFKVDFNVSPTLFHQVFLTGPAALNFTGEY